MTHEATARRAGVVVANPRAGRGAPVQVLWRERPDDTEFLLLAQLGARSGDEVEVRYVVTLTRRSEVADAG